MSIPQTKAHALPFNQILVRGELNSRSDLPKIEELAASIREQGLLQPLVVEPRGDGKFILRGGFRRAAALKLLKWGSKDVPVMEVGEGTRGEIVNLTENLAREDLHASDLAQRLHDLSKGEYDVAKGDEAITYTHAELAEKLGLSRPQVTNLIRSHANLTAACKRAWRAHDLPMKIIFKLASLDEDAQERELSAYLERKAKLDEVSKRSRRKETDEGPIDHSDKSDDEEAEDAEEEEEAPEERPAATRPGKRLIFDTLVEMKAELETASAKETAVIKAKVDTLKWVLGERKTFPKGAQ